MSFKRVSLICIFSLLISVIWLMNAAEAQEFVTDGLIAMWTLDEEDIDGDTVKDVSGNGNDAKIMGTLEIADGVIDQCLQFDGTQNYVEIPPMGSFEQVSVECWAYEAAFSGSQGIVSTWQWEPGKVHFKFESNEIQVDKNGAGKIRMAGPEAETWYHIIYTTETPTALKLYVDGELAAEGPGGADPEQWDERRIGSEHDGRFLNGMVDEVRVYDRVLDEDEVAQNFGVSSNEMAVDSAGKLAITWASMKSE
jgi:hypothetical protein